MNLKRLKRIGAAVLAICVMSAPTNLVFADETNVNSQKTELVFTDVTATDTTTLQGESKIKVSVKGVTGKASVVETSLKFESNDGVKYKSIQYKLGENNPPDCIQISPNASTVNSTGGIAAAIITNGSGVNLSSETDLFVLTFSGEAGKKVTLSCGDDGNSFITINDKDIVIDKCSPITAVTSTKNVDGINSIIKLTMNKVTDFNTSKAEFRSYRQIALKIAVITLFTVTI